MNPFDRNTSLALGLHQLIRIIFLYLGKQFLICCLLLVLPCVQLLHAVDDLPFLEGAMSDCGEHCIPVIKAILVHHCPLQLRRQYFHQIYIFRFTIVLEKLASLNNVVFFQLTLEPLRNLVFCL